MQRTVSGRAAQNMHLEAAVGEAVREAVVRVVEAVQTDAERQAVRVLGALIQPRAGALLLQPPQRVLHHLSAVNSSSNDTILWEPGDQACY